ncbi:MAG: MalY/PatB family protein [Candidatus Cryptobacteroides sp.]
MGKYDFDKIVDRRGTGALKLDVLKERYGRADLTPLWVADMDFETPSFITDALKQRLEHSLFGYTVEPEDYRPAIIDWIREHHGWEVRPEWLSYIPGIVKGIGMVVNVFVKPDEKVIIQPPVYHPFRLTPQSNGREVVYNPLIENPDGTYSMDFDNLEKVADSSCRLLILSNPHNPGGIVWDRDTLEKLARFCNSRGIIVISDEIHCDMALYGHKHIPFASVSPEAASCSITFSAPTKTFNIAGIVSSWCVVPDEKLRARFFSWLKANELDEPNMFAPIATVAALRNGEEWRREMLRYIEGNIDFVADWCAERIPQIKPLRPQASYLVWLDCRGLGLSHDDLIDLFVNKAKLALNDGEMFGPGGEGFMRLNVASPRNLLEQALRQLEDAVAGIPKPH